MVRPRILSSKNFIHSQILKELKTSGNAMVSHSPHHPTVSYSRKDVSKQYFLLGKWSKKCPHPNHIINSICCLAKPGRRTKFSQNICRLNLRKQDEQADRHSERIQDRYNKKWVHLNSFWVFHIGVESKLWPCEIGTQP